MPVAPTARAASSAARTASGGISRQARTTSSGARRSAARAAPTSAADTAALAPGATAMRFSARSSTTIRATPVGRVASARWPTSIPSSASAARAAAAEIVAPDGADEGDLRPEAGRGHGLVPALAAVMAGNVAAGHGLARPRQAGSDDHHVDVDRPDHDHATVHDTSPRTAHDRTNASWAGRSTVPRRAARTAAIASPAPAPPSTRRQATTTRSPAASRPITASGPRRRSRFPEADGGSHGPRRRPR